MRKPKPIRGISTGGPVVSVYRRSGVCGSRHPQVSMVLDFEEWTAMVGTSVLLTSANARKLAKRLIEASYNEGEGA